MIKKIRQTFHIFLSSLLLCFFLILIFLISLTIVSTIPSAKLKKQVGQSITDLKKEGTYPSIGLPIRKIVVDNFTNALMINTAYSINAKQPLKSALLDTRYDSLDNRVNQIHNLEMTYLKKPVQPVNYERYWHGHLIFLRPLLVFFSYSQIKNFLSFILYFLFSIFLFLIYKKFGPIKALIYLLSFLAVDFFSATKGLSFFSVFALAFLLTIYSLRSPPKKSKFFLYLIGGGLTAFFDIFTAPLIVWGLLISLELNRKKIRFFDLINNSLGWIGGYSFIWLSKWFIVQYLYLPGAVGRSISQIADRTSHPPDANFSRLNAIKLNFFQLVGYDKTDKILILLFLAIIFLFTFKYAKITKKKIRRILIFIGVGVIPYLWYFIVANHSYLHVWFTYRNQLISVISFFLIIKELIYQG